MVEFDLRTAIRLSSAMIGMMSIVLFLLRNSYPPSVRGLTHWASALAQLFVGYILLSMRNIFPDFVSIFVANLCLVFGVAFFYFGTRRHLGLKVNRGLWMGFGASCVIAIYFVPSIAANYALRATIIAFFIAIMMSLHAAVLFRHGEPAFAYRYTGTVIGIIAVICVARLMTYLFGEADKHLYEHSLGQALYLSTSIYGSVLAGVGFTLMASFQVRRELEHQARHDSMTGCLTRRAWFEICEQEMDRSVRNGRPMTVLMMDIDHFKKINDKFGHQAGDRAIINFVKNATTALRRADNLGRYGGEEFVALLPETDAEQARVVAERIRSMVESATDEPRCTVSVGIASNSVKLSVDGLLALADEAMYCAKRDGRNRVVTA